MSITDMEESKNVSSRRRWWCWRNLGYLGLVLGLAVSAFWVHETIWLPRDLQRAQGSWKFVTQHVEGTVIFQGRNVIWPFAPDGPLPIEFNNGRFTFYPTGLNERTILGINVKLPAWLSRPTESVYGTYEFKDSELILRVTGQADATRQADEQLDDQGHAIILKRE